MTTTRSSLTDLADSLRGAAKAYYDTDVELMDDAEYDSGIDQLRLAVADDPTLAPEFADLLEQVAAGQSAGGDVAHSSLMGSMDKATTPAAVSAFVAKLSGGAVVEPKMDGLAVAATYRGGRLVGLALRGDGGSGEDVAANAGRVAGLPQVLDVLDDIEVRGEVFMSDGDFAFSNAARVAVGKPAYKRARSAAAGALRKQTLAHDVRLSFAAYETTAPGADHLARMGELERHGFATAYRLMGLADVTAIGPARVLNLIEEFGQARPTAGFPTDGIVVKANDNLDRAALGEGSRAPKWAVAYKYEAGLATTTVEDIEITVGKTGRMGLRARVAPVVLDGADYTYVSLHNQDWLTKKDVRVGDTVAMYLANDIIPQIDTVLLDQRPSTSAAWIAPATCPQCDQAWNTDTLLWRCESPECSVLGRITYAAKRECLDIEGLGVEIATALVEGDHVRDIADLFDLGIVQLTSLEVGGRLLGALTAKKLQVQIEKAKSAPFNRVVTALGIRMTGKTMSRHLAAAFPTMDALRDASADTLATVDGIGQVKARAIWDGLHTIAPVIDRLAAAGVNMGAEPVQVAGAQPLAGMTVVVSGAVPGLTRTEIAEVIEANGGKASSSVSKATSLLVADPSTSSKYVKATELGVRIVAPAEFLTMVGR